MIFVVKILKFGKDQLGLVHEIGSFDGTYQKRSNRGAGGHSRYCFGSVISMSLGKILAYDVACNSCPKCTQYANQLEEHKIEQLEYDELVDSHWSTCPAKFSEYASVSLESELAPTILDQALERGIIFYGLVCDGDAKTFAKVTEHNPYANTVPLHTIQRFECLAHVGKCMKDHLIEHQKDKLKQARASKKFELKYLEKEGMDSQKAKRHVDIQFKGQLVRKNVSRGPWGESPEEPIYIDSTSKKVPQVKSHSTDIRFLTDEMCSRITSFYQLAVRQSLGNPDLILQSIQAIPLHLGANEFNSETNHKFCPKGVGSWCLYRNSIAHGQTPPRHPKCLSPDSVELVQAVFSKYRYDTEFFVNKIAHAHTSNNNEAVHNILFSMVRKTDAIGLSVMKLGSALAVIRYNEGYRAVLGILERLGVTIHPGIIELLSNLDKNRVEASGKLKEKQHKRFATRLKRQRKRTQSIRKFGKGYESGKFSFSNIENPEDEAVDEPIPSEIISEAPVVPTSSQADVEKCGICGRGEEDGIIDELNIFVNSELLKWIMCDSCSAWYHYICVGLDENDDFEEDEWRCDKC